MVSVDLMKMVTLDVTRIVIRTRIRRKIRIRSLIIASPVV